MLTLFAIFFTAPLMLAWLMFVVMAGPIVVLLRITWWVFVFLLRLMFLPLRLLMRC